MKKSPKIRKIKSTPFKPKPITGLISKNKNAAKRLAKTIKKLTT
tara:strand:- start:477 stop:608 length:132 start_codon:yes stop_codon:yes gene_type:complete